MTKVAMETVDPVRRRLAVEIPAGHVAEEIDRAYDQLRRRARVPGFRQGRAPRPVLERLFGTQVQADVYERLVRESYVEALREQHIEPVGSPEIITEQAEPGEPLRYSATVEVRPEIVVGGYTGLSVERPRRVVADEDVDRVIDNLRQSHARLVPVADREVAQAGDVATIDYSARSGDAVVGRGDGRLVEIGGDQPESPGAHLVGAHIGVPASFAIDYPAEHPNAELAGKHVTFSVTISKLHDRQVPPLDDAFAEEHADCESVAALRARVRNELDVSARREADSAVRSALMARLVERHEFEVPEAMIERRIDALVEDVIESLGPRRPPASREAALRQQLRGDLRQQARDQVKAALLLETIAAQEHLTVDDAELDARIDRLAEAAGRARERVRALYQDAAARASLRGRLLQERALELVVERASVKDIDPTSAVAGSPGNG